MTSASVDTKSYGELQALITSRLTVHDFSSDPLPEGALARAITAALTAPNHRMTEPWRFVRVGRNTRSELAVISARLKDKGQGPSAESLARARDKMLSSPELIVVCRALHPNPAVSREDYAAVACAIQNLSLSLWAEGIGSKWSTGGVTTDPETYRLLGLQPSAVEIVGFVWVGYAKPGSLAKKPPRRLTVTDVLTEVP